MSDPDPRDVLAATLRHLAARLRDLSDSTQDVDELRRQVVVFLAESHRLLSSSGESSLSVAMPQAQKIAHLRERPGRPVESRHPFPLALEARGSSVEEWARKHSVNPKTAKSWYATGGGRRRISRANAETIERELGIPATRLVWPAGIRD